MIKDKTFKEVHEGKSFKKDLKKIKLYIEENRNL